MLISTPIKIPSSATNILRGRDQHNVRGNPVGWAVKNHTFRRWLISALEAQ